VTSLELRLAQVAERLAATLDLMLRQTKTAHSDHLLLETLIESLNTLGAIEKDKLTKNWRERVTLEELRDSAKTRRGKLIGRILEEHKDDQHELFAHLVNEGVKLISADEEKQGLRTLERASLLSPGNVSLLVFIAETLFRADKFELAKSYLEKAQILAPQDAEILLLLAVIYADEGSIAQSKPLIDALAQRKEFRFCVGYVRGMIGALENEWSETLLAFKEALLANNSPETHYLIACAYFQLGRNKMAVRHLQKTVEEDANYSDAWYMLSVIYEITGEAAKAHEAAELAWTSKEAGAQCLEFLKRKKPENLLIALI
jgi:predicted Zn-dependent protease